MTDLPGIHVEVTSKCILCQRQYAKNIVFHLQQLDRLDPVQEAISILGFKISSHQERTLLIDKFFWLKL